MNRTIECTKCADICSSTHWISATKDAHYCSKQCAMATESQEKHYSIQLYSNLVLTNTKTNTKTNIKTTKVNNESRKIAELAALTISSWL